MPETCFRGRGSVQVPKKMCGVVQNGGERGKEHEHDLSMNWDGCQWPLIEERLHPLYYIAARRIKQETRDL